MPPSPSNVTCTCITDHPMPRLLLDMPSLVAQGTDDASWFELLQYILPFSDDVFIAGSTATWLAQHSIQASRPQWDPTEVYVFITVRNAGHFGTIVDAVVDMMTCSPSLFRYRVMRASSRLIRVYWWLQIGGIEYPCPHFCFKHCALAAAQEILQHFELDICQVLVSLFRGAICLEMSASVYQHIRDGHMLCSIRRGHDGRYEERIARYTSRGYVLIAWSFGWQYPAGGYPSLDSKLTIITLSSSSSLSRSSS